MNHMLSEGCRVSHKKYGSGTIAYVERKRGLRHRSSLNVGVIFDKGGPQGWAEDSSNSILDLKRIDELRRAA